MVSRWGADLTPPNTDTSIIKSKNKSELLVISVKLSSGDCGNGTPLTLPPYFPLRLNFLPSAKLVRQLSMKGASEVARQLASASARLLVETSYRPARRQAAVIVANLSTTPELRAALLSFDSYPRRLPSPSRETTSIQNCSIGLVDALVSLAFDDGRIQRVAGVEGSEPPNKEEEIGTRRECMRALVGLTKCSELRNLVSLGRG